MLCYIFHNLLCCICHPPCCLGQFDYDQNWIMHENNPSALLSFADRKEVHSVERMQIEIPPCIQYNYQRSRELKKEVRASNRVLSFAPKLSL